MEIQRRNDFLIAIYFDRDGLYHTKVTAKDKEALKKGRALYREIESYMHKAEEKIYKITEKGNRAILKRLLEE